MRVSSSGLWECGNRFSDFQGTVGRVGNLSLRYEPASRFAEVFHAFHPSRHFHSPCCLCRRRAFFRSQRLAPGVVRRWLFPLPSRSLLRLGTRLRRRPGDLLKSHRAVFVEHLQLALARLLHGDSRACSQSLIALRFQLQKRFSNRTTRSPETTRSASKQNTHFKSKRFDKRR